MRLFEIPRTSMGCNQQSPSELDASLSQHTLKFAILGRLPNGDESWVDTLTLEDSILHILRRCKGIQTDYFTEFKESFSQVARIDSSCLCVGECAYAIANVLGTLVSEILKYFRFVSYCYVQ